MLIYFLLCLVLKFNFELVSTEKCLSRSQNTFQKTDNRTEYENFMAIDQLKNFTEYCNNFLFGKSPPFDLTISDDITPKCRLHSAEYQRQLQNLTFWAIKMYDSSAKIPSGILSGNINQLGDFDECVSTRSNDGQIVGKYCLTYFQIDEPNSKYLSKLNNLLNTNFPFRSSFNDAARHNIPSFSNINWALCVPSSCSHEDVEIALKTGLQPLMDQTGISIQIKVFKDMCQTAERPIPLSTILAGLFFVAIIGFTLIVTAIDYFFQYPLTDLNGLQGIIFSFSLRRTLTSLFSTKSSGDDITSVHGMRFINMVLLIIVHKSMVTFFLPYTNRATMAWIIMTPFSVLVRAGNVYTDTFLMFSGMLTSFSHFGRVNRGKNINIIEEYITRLFRIVPPLMAIILFCASIQPWLGSGPQWNLLVTHQSELCKSYWWRNLLFIQNYFGYENMCAPFSHHVSTDTHLFLLSPIFLGILIKWHKRGVIILLVLAVISTVLRFQAMFSKGLTLFMHFGGANQQYYDSLNATFLRPTHRITVYVLGVLLGYYLRNMKNVILKPAILNVGHATAAVLLSAVYLGTVFMRDISYKFDPIHGAWYTSFAPIAWCLPFAWLVFTEHFGYPNALNKLLSWPGFMISTRLSYAIYLTQFPVMFYNAGSTRSSGYFQTIKTMVNVHEIGVIVLCSIVLTLLFDSPFQTIKRICFKKYKNQTSITQTEGLKVENNLKSVMNDGLEKKND